MNKIIIGIHGLANKPDHKTLENYWRKALVEGLKNIDYTADAPFECVYWANLLYKHPMHRHDSFNFDSLYNDEPNDAVFVLSS